MLDVNPNNPEAIRLQQIKNEAESISQAMPQMTGLPGLAAQSGQTAITPEEEYVNRMKQMMLMQMAGRSQNLSKPIPEQAKYSEFIISTRPFEYEKKDGEKIMKSGHAPVQQIEERYGAFSPGMVLSKLTDQEIGVVDIDNKLARLYSRWTHRRKDIDTGYLLKTMNIDMMAYASIRRPRGGFAMEALTKSTQENIQTLQTESQVGYAKQKNRLFGLLGGK